MVKIDHMLSLLGKNTLYYMPVIRAGEETPCICDSVKEPGWFRQKKQGMLEAAYLAFIPFRLNGKIIPLHRLFWRSCSALYVFYEKPCF
jgi:hypothetical protein